MAAPLVEALVAILDASRAYLPDGMSKDEFITKVLEAVDNPKIIAALAAHYFILLGGSFDRTPSAS
jgi:hypothetical protein